MSDSGNIGMKESLVAAEYIAKNAQEVHINESNIEKLAKHITFEFKEDNIQHFSKLISVFWRPETYPDANLNEAINWLFVFHTLNFSLFNAKNKKQWTAGNTQGCFALSFAIKRAIDEKKPLWNPKYYSRLTLAELQHIFRSDDGETSIPLIHRRREILQSVGRLLLRKYAGTFEQCINICKYNPQKLKEMLFNEFESYRDEAIYKDKKVRLHTKINSLLSDIWRYFCRINLYHICKQNRMSTMFIDYRSPIVLHHFEILRYSDKLINRFKNCDKPLKHGSLEELEIRACSLIAANKLRNYVANLLFPNEDKDLQEIQHSTHTIILIDNFLLGFLADKFYTGCMDHEPFHYIRSVYY